MRQSIIPFALALAALSPAQKRVVIPGLTLEPASGELSATQAVDRAVAFFNLVGSGPVDRAKVQYNIIYDPACYPEKRRMYEIDCGVVDLEMNPVTGAIDFFAVSSYAFRPSAARATLVPPSPARAEAIVEATAKAVGLPLGARRTHFGIVDQNPKKDADMRGYFNATYTGVDGNRLNLVFDRLSGRLEFMMRYQIPPDGATDKPVPQKRTPPKPS